MSAWTITQKPSYLSDFVELPKDLQKAIVKALDDMAQDPVTPRGNTIKKLKGFTNVWRYRLGATRLIYAVDHGQRMVNLLAVGARGDVYQRFNYEGWDAPGAAVDFGPELTAAPIWQEHPEWFQPEGPQLTKSPLPRKLSPSQLDRWMIPPEFHSPLMRCLYEEDLLECAVPHDIIGKVMDGLYPPTVEQLAAQPDLMLLDADDLLRYADGTLTSFLLKLDEQQQPLTRWALSGPTLVKGGPGSGKSTVALYRLRALVEQAVNRNGRMPDILFTTYTNALINFSEALLNQLLYDLAPTSGKGALPRSVRISTYHKTALWIAKSSREEFQMAQEHHRLEALHAGRAALQPRTFGDASKIATANAIQPLRDDYLLEEFDWVIEGQNCQSEVDYLTADRTGRGISFTTARRQAVWRLFDLYRENLLAQGLYTWGHLVQVALAQVKSGAFDRRWDYVIVDEAQDLPPAALSLAIELCRTPAGVFLTADANQSLYNRGFRWRNVHGSLKLAGRTRVLRRNYRSTRQIAAAAAEIVSSDPEMDDEAIRQEHVHSGPQPIIYAATGSTDQWRWIARQIYESARALRLPVNAATVLVSSSTVGEPLAVALTDYGLPAHFMNSQQFDLDAPGIKVTTLHAAKGLEFPIVVIAHAEAGRIPRETEATDEEELAAFDEAQRRLLFVGCTRAMRRLFITYNQELPSPFLAGLSTERWQRVAAQAN